MILQSYKEYKGGNFFETQCSEHSELSDNDFAITTAPYTVQILVLFFHFIINRIK